MQRKRHINFKDFLSTFGSILDLEQRIRKSNLHNIPTYKTMKNDHISDDTTITSVDNLKSNVLYSIPCVKSCACTFCRVVNTLRNNSSNDNAYTINDDTNTSSNSHSTNVVRWTSPHLKNQNRSSRTMTPYSRISSWSKLSVFTFLLLSISFLSILGSMIIGSESCYAASASLTLGTTGTISSNATAGSVAYVSNTITASASDIESYTLSITGPVGLSSNSGSTITGANNNKPSTMPNNSWGYSYNEDALSNDNKTYKSFTGSAQTLESGTTPSNTAKNITFAAKFGEDAISGHYKATVNVNLVATPKRVIFDGITTMQEMTPEICKNAAQNETKQLKDSRDNKLYWVTKLKDDNCWMTQNLDYDGGGEKRITISEWANSSSDGEYWDPGNKVGNGNGEDATSTTDQHLLSGNYYNYTAALAVCPSGWRLPTGNSTTIDGSFGKLLDGITTSDIINAAPYYFQYGGAITSKWSGSVFTSGAGEYWSSTPNDDIRAYSLKFSTSSINSSYPQTDYGRGRSNGLSVRCLATSSISYSITYDPGNTDTTGLRGAALEKFNSHFPVQTSPNNYSGNSYTFTIPTSGDTYIRGDLSTSDGTGSFMRISGWSITKGSSTVQYQPGATITVTKNEPHIILYPIWEGTGTGIA